MAHDLHFVCVCCKKRFNSRHDEEYGPEDEHDDINTIVRLPNHAHSQGFVVCHVCWCELPARRVEEAIRKELSANAVTA